MKRHTLRLMPVAALLLLVGSAWGKQAIELSPEAYAMFDAWHQGPPGAISLEESIVDEARTDLVRDWIEELRWLDAYIEFQDHLRSVDVNAWQRWRDDLMSLGEDPGDDGVFATYVLAMDSSTFESWEGEMMLNGAPSLERFVQQADPAFYEVWQVERDIPAATLTLTQWLQTDSSKSASMARDELLASPLASKAFSKAGCSCQVVFTISGTPNSFFEQDHVFQNESKKKKRYWSEQWRGAHYMEAYVYGKGQKMNLDHTTLRRQNETKIRARLHCTNGGTICHDGCQAKLRVYADYHSRVQVHTDTWGLFGGKSEAAAADIVRLHLDGNGGRLTLLDKAVAIKQTSEQKFKLDKAVELAAALIQLGAAVFAKSDAVKIAKLTATAVKKFKGVVEVKGKKGTNTQDLRALFDSTTNSDPFFSMFSNDEWVASLSSDGRIAYDGEGRNKTANSYYGSQDALALAINEYQCSGPAPSPIGIWSHSHAFRSPFYGTTNSADNIENFLEFVFAVNGNPLTNSHEGSWQPNSGGSGNRARNASTSASSTFSGYSPARINDGSRNTRVGGAYSWSNQSRTMPQWVQLSWPSSVTASRVELYTSAGFPIRDYNVQYWTGSSWANLAVVNGNTSLHRIHTFSAINTTRIRVLGRSGPNNQTIHVRVNELEVY